MSDKVVQVLLQLKTPQTCDLFREKLLVNLAMGITYGSYVDTALLHRGVWRQTCVTERGDQREKNWTTEIHG